MVTVNDYSGKIRPDWCPACGNFAQLSAIKNALAELKIEPENAVVVSGIGCSSNLPEFIRAYGFHGLHGRLLPVASAVKWANRKLTVIGYGGDGDGFFEGTQHFFHTAKRNVDLTYIVSDNQIFGLTTGQASPTSEIGFISKTTPDGNIEKPVNPMTFALSAGATFVARSFSGDPKHLQEVIKKGIQHKGFSFIDVFSPCVTFNKTNTYDYFRKRVYKYEAKDPSNFEEAYRAVQEWGDRIPIGIFYQVKSQSYEDLDPVTAEETPLAERPYRKLKPEDFEEFL
ncbi:MAG: thiamine pyrophosphate-dependent enzyme [Candidatus Thermoplasmatota archaeon]|jgi:2-oxoglutarate ferredoxin oxidoreductase subunit beta|nr:thiamine pyrophosphate-dependent enzyme [Candidatus Thermoplasmatota archaeon]MCL5799902.1 thiamine pyrophosphate-dependent enzyme [Candidatus Thermoplasmatota archaeon]